MYAIAADVGYKDYKYFIAIFKKYAGCTPSYYQERYGLGQNSGKRQGTVIRNRQTKGRR